MPLEPILHLERLACIERLRVGIQDSPDLQGWTPSAQRFRAPPRGSDRELEPRLVE